MKAVVLNSGGIDSTTCLGIAIDKYGKENVATVSVKHIQKNYKELDCAKKIAAYYGVPHYEMDLSQIIKKVRTSTESASNLPFRNGVFLTAVVPTAMSIFPNEELVIYCGMHADDSVDFPDTTREFYEAISLAVSLGTGKKVHIESPLVTMEKKDVIALGTKLDVPYELTWTCYKSNEEEACGECLACRIRLKAFRLNGLTDPIKYRGV